MPIDDQDRLPTLENAAKIKTGTGDMEQRHDALEGEGAMEPPGYSED